MYVLSIVHTFQVIARGAVPGRLIRITSVVTKSVKSKKAFMKFKRIVGCYTAKGTYSTLSLVIGR